MPEISKLADIIVAEVDGRSITLGEVSDAVKELPLELQSRPFHEVFPIARGQLIAKLSLVIEATRSGLDNDPAVQRRIRAMTNTILADEYVRQQAAQDITEKALLDRYARELEGKIGPEEMHLRVIVVQKLSDALTILKQLKADADFAKLAERYSTDPSAASGGDVGFVSPVTLMPELANAAMAIPSGQISATPISSRGAWFLLKVEARRPGQPLPFATIREQIMRRMVRDAAPDVVRRALASATVRLFSINGIEEAPSSETKPTNHDNK